MNPDQPPVAPFSGRRRGATGQVITVTHDQAIASHADKVFRLHDGKLAAG